MQITGYDWDANYFSALLIITYFGSSCIFSPVYLSGKIMKHMGNVIQILDSVHGNPAGTEITVGPFPPVPGFDASSLSQDAKKSCARADHSWSLFSPEFSADNCYCVSFYIWAYLKVYFVLNIKSIKNFRKWPCYIYRWKIWAIMMKRNTDGCLEGEK